MANAGFKQRVHEAVQQGPHSGRVIYQLDSSQEKSHHSDGRLMGGTGIIAAHDVVGRLEPGGKGGDRMGRWSYMHFRRHRGAPVTVISVYQVCLNPTNKIGQTAWHQQRRALDLAGNSSHPRTAFTHDLEAFIQRLTADNHDIILGGDWNDCLSAPNSHLLKLCTSLDLVDPWLTFYPHHTDFPTFELGTHRIDSVLVSRRLVPSIAHIGYSPVGGLFNTDHRTVILELNTKGLFGNATDPLPALISRGVRTKDLQSVTTFIETMHSHLASNNVFHRAKTLSDPIVGELHFELVENLDCMIGEAGDQGDKRCRRRRPQWYSVATVQQRLEVSYLRHYRNGLKAGIDRLQATEAKLLYVQKPQLLPTDVPAMDALIREKATSLSEATHRSAHVRQDMLESHATTLDGVHQRARASTLRRINRHEQSIDTWRTMSFLSSSTITQKLDRLEIPHDWPLPTSVIDSTQSLSDPKTATRWTTITDPYDIEYYLMLRNRMHFGQAQGTPFTESPLADHVDWTATSPSSDEILEGSYVPSATLSQLCHSVLSACRATAPQDDLPAELTIPEFEGKIRRWRETTTTSPSGRHLGRYKALYSRGTHSIADDEKAQKRFLHQQQEIASVILQIINFCIRTGHVLSRWKQIVNTMIFKDSGVYQIHRLRVIHIYEADFNLLLAVKWRALLHYADRAHLIHNGQYGGRPGREATSLALLEELRIDISYITRRTLITFDNDAASCYDRIIPAFASLINRKYGLHKQLAIIHAKTLREAKYKLRTAIGISDTEYSHTTQFPLYGSGQGSGNSPVLWLFISATLFDVHDGIAHGATFQDPTGKYAVDLKLSGFVDDTNAALNDWQPQREADLPTLLDRLTHDAQTWNDLLFISGGKLELSKCSFHMLRFDFKPDGTPRPSLEIPPSIVLKDSVTQEDIKIDGLGAAQPHKTLGHWKSPAGPQRKQLQTIQAKTQKLGKLIGTSSLSRYGAQLAYQAKYVAGLRYVLPQCHFSAKELRKAESKSMPLIIAKCGFCRKTSYALLFLPPEYAGGGFVHWDTIQGTGQIQHFIKHWRTSTDISTALRIDVAWSQWQAGTNKPLLVDVHTKLPYLESRWLPSLRTALCTSQSQIILDQPFVQPPERVGDQHIMDIARRSKLYTDQDMSILNYCRLYLHVTTISELRNAAGTTLLPHVLTCHRPPWFDPDTITVIQRRPSDYQVRNKWRRFCVTLCSIPTLGPWKRRKHRSLRLRRETYSLPGPQSTINYHWFQGAYWECSLSEATTGQFVLTNPTLWTPDSAAHPIDCRARIRCTVYLELTPEGYAAPQPPGIMVTPKNAPGFQDYLTTIPKWEQELLAHITWVMEPFAIGHYLQTQLHLDDNLMIVSDGSSFENRTMSFGVIIGTASGIILAENMGPAFGQPSSHRAECTGCLSGALILYHLLQFTRLPLPPHIQIVEVISDNQGMIKSCEQRRTYTEVYANATLVPDWDLLEEIHRAYARCKIQQALIYKWVKGHQDSRPDKQSRLSQDAKFNIRADELAGEYQIMVNRDIRRTTPLMGATKCILQIDNASQHGHYAQALRRAASEPDFFHYLTGKHHWGPTTHHEVDWLSFRMASRTFHTTDVQLLKLVHNQLPTRHHLSKFQPWVNPKCHHCEAPETFDHIQQSSCNPVSQRYYHDIATSLNEYFDKHNTPRDFRNSFLHGVHRWIDHSDDQEDDNWEQDHQWAGTRKLRHSQRDIGWRLLIRGFLSIHWRKFLLKTRHQEKWATKLEDDSANSLGFALEDEDTSDFDPEWLLTEQEIDAAPTNEEELDDAEFTIEFNSDIHQSSSDLPRPPTASTDPTIFLAGIIKILWTEMSTLWRSHLDYNHKTSETKNSPVTVQDNQQQVRALHNLRNQVLPAHKDSYFHENVDDFLETSTAQQLGQYITLYQPVILDSISRNKKHARRSQPSPSSPTTNPSLRQRSRTRQQSPNDLRIPQQRRTPAPDRGENNRLLIHPALEEAPHRKSTRIRQQVEPRVPNQTTATLSPPSEPETIS